MKASEPTVRVLMLCNHQELENGKEYSLPVERANVLTGIGMARAIDSAPAQEEI